MTKRSNLRIVVMVMITVLLVSLMPLNLKGGMTYAHAETVYDVNFSGKDITSDGNVKSIIDYLLLRYNFDNDYSMSTKELADKINSTIAAKVKTTEFKEIDISEEAVVKYFKGCKPGTIMGLRYNHPDMSIDTYLIIWKVTDSKIYVSHIYGSEEMAYAFTESVPISEFVLYMGEAKLISKTEPTKFKTHTKMLLQAEAIKTREDVDIAWTRAKDIKTYKLYRASSKNGTYKLIKTVSKTGKTAFKDTTAPFGKKSYYKVVGIKANGAKVTSLKTNAIRHLSRPTNLRAQDLGNTTLDIMWDPVKGADKYKVIIDCTVGMNYEQYVYEDVKNPHLVVRFPEDYEIGVYVTAQKEGVPLADSLASNGLYLSANAKG